MELCEQGSVRDIYEGKSLNMYIVALFVLIISFTNDKFGDFRTESPSR